MGTEKLEQVRAELISYIQEHPEIPEPVVPLIDTLIANNVSFDNADQFCADHFIKQEVADYYKRFYIYVMTLLNPPTETEPEQEDGSEVLSLINEIQDRLDRLKAILS
jgi:hypothetical protein